VTTHTDDRGTSIKEGDFVSVLYVDRGRGAEQWMGKGQVIASAASNASGSSSPLARSPNPLGASA